MLLWRSLLLCLAVLGKDLSWAIMNIAGETKRNRCLKCTEHVLDQKWTVLVENKQINSNTWNN